MEKNRVKIGVLALEAGYMTPFEVENTHMLQLRSDKKFGELAVENGYLTEDQVKQLLSKQKSQFALFGQALIDEGFMTFVELFRYLGEYKKSCDMSDNNFLAFQKGAISPVIDKAIDIEDTFRRDFIKTYIEIFIKNVIRFVNEDVSVGALKTVPDIQGDWVSSQIIEDDSNSKDILSAFSGAEKSMLNFACGFSKDSFDSFNDMPQDILGEFLNCSNGIFISNMADRGYDYNLRSQIVTKDKQLIDAENYYCVPFFIEANPFHLIMAI
jgi:hypothetical protein